MSKIKIKPEKPRLKAMESEIQPTNSDILDLKTMDSNFIINRLEENIKLREMPLEKRAFKK